MWKKLYILLRPSIRLAETFAWTRSRTPARRNKQHGFIIKKRRVYYEMNAGHTQTQSSEHTIDERIRRSRGTSTVSDGSRPNLPILLNNRATCRWAMRLSGLHEWRSIVSARHERHYPPSLKLSSPQLCSSKNVSLSKEFWVPSWLISCSLLCCCNSFLEFWFSLRSLRSDFPLEAYSWGRIPL